ncbi:MAG: hypothetical protein ACJ76Y_01320 [Thermoanaerobaculia bacterium]
MITKRILPVLAVLLLAAAAPALATVTVTVSSPASTANVPTSFNVVASASTDAAGAKITGWWIYVDSVQAWHGNATGSVNAPLTLSAGSHQVLVRAWDSTGAFGTQILNLTAAACGGVCVTVTSPSETGSVPTPVRFTASAADGAGRSITGFVVYVNNTNAFQNHIGTLDQWVILNPGTYNVYIRAWDSSGAFGTSATFPITVQGTTIPTPPAGALVFDDLDDAAGWGSCTDCAGGGTLATSWPMTQNVASPSHDGGSTHFQIFGPAWADALWWKKVGANDTATNFLWDFWFYLPSSSTTAQALEFDAFQFTPINGTLMNFMFGSQCNYGRGGFWDGWNQQTGHWVQTSFPCSFSTGVWHHAVYFVQRVGDARDQVLYGNVTIDGVTTQWNLLEPVGPTPAGWSSNLGVQFQLDIGSSGTDLEEWVDDVKLTVW